MPGTRRSRATRLFTCLPSLHPLGIAFAALAGEKMCAHLLVCAWMPTGDSWTVTVSEMNVCVFALLSLSRYLYQPMVKSAALGQGATTGAQPEQGGIA